MISLLTLVLNTISGAIIYAAKALLSLVTWFAKSFFKLMKFAYVVLPITCIVFALLLCLNVFILVGNFGRISGSDAPPQEAQVDAVVHEIDIPGNIVDDTRVQQGAGYVLRKGTETTVNVFTGLYTWWMKTVYFYNGSTAYIPLFILTIILFLPVVSVLLCISVLFSYGNILFFAIVADTFLYVIRAVLGSGFIKQALSRYFRLFPEAGRRHYEKNYDKWLQNRNKEIEAEERANRRRRKEGFYEDERDYEEDYVDEDEEDFEYEEPVKFSRRGRNRRFADNYDRDYIEEDDEYYEDDASYDDEDYYEDEDFEDDYDDPRTRRRYEEDYNRGRDSGRTGSGNPVGAFDFFAGCNSRESVDKKYKSLVKLYHPDNMDGDTAALQEINAQYAEAKKRF